MIRLTFDLTFEEFAEANSRCLPRRSPPLAKLGWIIPILLIVSGVACLFSWKTRAEGFWFLGIGVVLLAVSPGVRRWDAAGRLNPLLRSLFEKSCSHHEMTFSAEEWTDECACGCDIRKWEAVKAYSESKDILLLQMKNGSAYIVPTRVLNPESRTELIGLLEEKRIPSIQLATLV
jgi:hypothetical protein